MYDNEPLIKERLADAKAIAWDGCHKIYLLMDDEQVQLMRDYGYTILITTEQATPEVMFHYVRKWWAESCSLRFIECVSTHSYNPNMGFETLVAQDF